MAEAAHVSSSEALEAFRARLLLFRSRARAAVDEVAAEVQRTRQWLEHDQRRFWDNELRRARRALEAAQQELFSSRLSKLEQATAAQQMAVHRAEAAVRAAEAKLAALRKWSRDFEHRITPVARQVEPLHGFLSTNVAQAAAELAQILVQLAAYAEQRPPAVVPSAPAPPAAPSAP
jgi:chromosome segregation ATPase